MLVGARARRPCLRLQSKVHRGLHSLSYTPAPSIWTHRPATSNVRQWQYRSRPGVLRYQGTYSGGKQAENSPEIINDHSALTAEANARQARIQYGDSLPAGLLKEDEYKIYERLFGAPATMLSAEETLEFEEGPRRVELELDSTQDNELSTPKDPTKHPESEFVREQEEDEEYDEEEEEFEEKEDMERMLEREKAEAEYYEMTQVSEASLPRTHPLTLEGRFNDSPAIFELPRESMVDPTAAELGKLSNKHISEAADRMLGGYFMPDSVATPRRPHLQQAPPRLTATQSAMTPIEAGLFLAANMPGMYGCTSSALVETRKRLGPAWLDRVLNRTGGPRILDVGSAGAAVQAWREVLRAEWERMHPKAAATKDAPLGKSTIVVGSPELRERVRHLSSDTTFLPRLPDFDRNRDLPGWKNFEPGARKHYDVIVASHSLWTFEEEYERRNMLQNLWSLLDPNGGVLIVIEKGVPRGFELVAGARQLLLNDHIASPDFTTPEQLLDESPGNRNTAKEPGMIVAPCTNHGQCPMYKIPGEMKGRKDYCHFSTRFVRPPYLKRLIGPRARDHERIRFSYVSAQRGVDLRETQGIRQGEGATLAAFEGFEHAVPKSAGLGTPASHEPASLSETNTGTAQTAHSSDTLEEVYPVAPSIFTESSTTDNTADTTTTSSSSTSHVLPPSTRPSPLTYPRLILPPLKRHGHVTFDVCTPSATVERWTLPKSRSRQAYRDARKAKWGDLWALGAKTRTPRLLRTGVPKNQVPKSGRIPRDADRELEVVAEERDHEGDWVDVPGAPKGKGTSRKKESRGDEKGEKPKPKGNRRKNQKERNLEKKTENRRERRLKQFAKGSQESNV